MWGGSLSAATGRYSAWHSFGPCPRISKRDVNDGGDGEMKMNRDYEEPFDDEEHWTAEVMEKAVAHPTEEALRVDRLPHIWCPGCGIGIALTCFVGALKEAGINLSHLSVVSGIGCTGRVAGYVLCDSFHTTHGRAIPFAVGLHVANPDLDVVVFSGDGDLTAIG